MKNEFLKGFAQATGLDRQEAEEEWAAFSRQLSGITIRAIEDGGYEAGVREGRRFRAMYPEEVEAR